MSGAKITTDAPCLVIRNIISITQLTRPSSDLILSDSRHTIITTNYNNTAEGVNIKYLMLNQISDARRRAESNMRYYDEDHRWQHTAHSHCHDLSPVHFRVIDTLFSSDATLDTRRTCARVIINCPCP